MRFPDNWRLHPAFSVRKLILGIIIVSVLSGLTVQSVLADQVVALFQQYYNIGVERQHTTDLAVGDVDNDGDLDVIVANTYHYVGATLITWQAQNYLYRNDGLGNLSDEAKEPIGPNNPSSAVALGDLDRDGDLDLVVGNAVFTNTVTGGQVVTLTNEARNIIYYNDGHGNFIQHFAFPTSDNTTSLVLADMNGDRALDIIVGNHNEQSYLYFNNGNGNFTDTSRIAIGSGDRATTSLAVGDVDGDGRLDLLVGNFMQPNQLYLNSGGNTLSLSLNFTPAAAPTMRVALGDLNGQPGPELIVGNRLAQSFVYYNNGQGNFHALPPNPFSAPAYPAKDLVLTDLNGDRKLDIVLSSDRLFGSTCPPGATCIRSTLYYLNAGAGTFLPSVEVSRSPAVATVLAAADLNNDGLMDLIEGKLANQNVISLNTGLHLFPTSQPFGAASASMTGIAVGDFDGVNGLDIAAVADGAVQLFLNDGRSSFSQATPIDTAGQRVTTLVAGDIDGDHDLDLLMTQRIQISNQAVEQIRIYQNDGAGHFIRQADSLERHSDYAWVMRLGDLDGDGDLDVAVGGAGPNELYLNDGAGHFPVSRLWDTVSGWTMDLALGDVDGDGDLDLAEANQLGTIPSRLYFNDGHANFNEHLDLGAGSDDTLDIAFGDIDNDGDLDIIKGNEGQQNRIYLNDGMGRFPTTRPYGPGNDVTSEVVIADYDENGFLDLFDSLTSGFYLNNGTGDFLHRVALPPDWPAEVMAADMNRDGYRDLVLGEIHNQRFSRVYLHAATASGLVITQPGATALGVGYYTAEILDTPTLAVGITLYDAQSTPMRALRVCYSVNGGGDWQMAVPQGRPQPAANDVVQPATGCPYVPAWEEASAITLTTAPTGASHTFHWNVHESGFFGRSDNVVLRVEALPDLRPTANSVAGVYEQPRVASSTQPFRLRGTQIRVIDESGRGVADALVYQRKAGQLAPGAAIGNGATAYRTEGQGYLQGFGKINIDDELLALAPQPWAPTGQLAWARGLTNTIHLYHTNGMPTATGIETQIENETTTSSVKKLGTQILRVSASNPLLLFDLTVSLEWDASTEEGQTYLGQLRASLRKAAEHLYDFTNGQVALGEVTVLQNAEDWGYADVVVQAANRLRPYAVQGGIVLSTTADFDHASIHYDTGHVRMGATWSRYGNPGEELGGDWALALAHELSHYFFFLDDTYLGLDANGLLIPIDSCIGSVMGDMYNPSGVNTEFLSAVNWLPGCANTLAHRTLGRPEWATIMGRYPMLKAPATYAENSGPAWLPYELTTVVVVNPLTPTTSLPDPTFYLNYSDGGFSSSNARAFLIRDEQYAFDLGSPLGGQNILKARGAQIDDILCAFDPQRAHFGCMKLTGASEQLPLHSDPTWQPQIEVRPVTSSTLEIRLRSMAGVELPTTVRARIFPEFGEASAEVLLNSANDYTAQFSFTTISASGAVIPVPVTLGHVLLWTDTLANPPQASMVAFRMGGDVGRWPALRAGGPALRAGGPALRAGGPALRAGGPALRAGGAPIVSADGQMIFFTENPEAFAQGMIFTVQSTNRLPPLPTAKRLIGLGYNLLASSTAVTTIPGSVSFQYLGIDALQQGVTEADEAQLTIYYHPNQSSGTWRPLATVRNSRYNLASATSQGPGFYALFAGPQQPTITAMTPSWGYRDAAVTVTFTGVELLAPLTVRLRGADNAISPSYAATLHGIDTAVVTIPPGLPAQAYQVELINGDQSIAVVPLSFALLERHTSSCFFDDFTSGPGQWQLDGQWAVIAHAGGGGNAITDSPTGNYDSALPNSGHLSVTLTSRPFDLSACPDPQLTFRHAYVIAVGAGHSDLGIVEIRPLNADVWQLLAEYQGGGIYDVQTAALGSEWQGIQLQPATPIDLAAYQGIVQLRFRLELDEDVADRGWLIDDVAVQSVGGAAEAPGLTWPTDQLFLPSVMR